MKPDCSLTSFAHPESVVRKFSRLDVEDEQRLYFEKANGQHISKSSSTFLNEKGLFISSGFTGSYSQKDRYILQLDNAEIHSDKLYVLTSSGFLTESVSNYDANAMLKTALDPSYIEIDQPALVVGNIGYQNYYHWVFQGVSVILEAQEQFKSLPKLVIPPINSWRRQYFELLDVDPMNCVVVNSHSVIRPKITYYSSFSGTSFPFAPHSRIISLFSKFANSIVRAPTASESSKLYISRKDSTRRSIVNESELAELLNKYGYVEHRLEELSVRQQIELFYSATDIVASHGAGLTNLLFSEKCNSLTELFPENYLNSCFFRICQAKAIDHYAMTSKVTVENGRHHSHSEVDLRALEKHLQTLHPS